MFLTEDRRAILRALTAGPLDPWQIAADLGRSGASVRLELRAMRRERLVDDDLDPRATHVTWRLTDRGRNALAAAEQLVIS